MYLPVANDKLMISERGFAMWNLIRCRISFGILFGPYALLLIFQLITFKISKLSVGWRNRVCSELFLRYELKSWPCVYIDFWSLPAMLENYLLNSEAISMGSVVTVLLTKIDEGWDLVSDFKCMMDLIPLQVSLRLFALVKK